LAGGLGGGRVAAIQISLGKAGPIAVKLPYSPKRVAKPVLADRPESEVEGMVMAVSRPMPGNWMR